MKYIAVLDTDDFEDFDFFEDGKEKYLHAIDATSENGEWIYLPFRPLEQEPIIDKIRAEIEKLRPNLRPEQMTDYDYAMVGVVNDIVAIIDKVESEE